MTYSFLIKFFASGFFLGYTPFAPGTVATLLAILIYLVLPKNLFFYTIFTLFIFFAGVYLAERAEKIFTQKDDRRIVIDEIACFFVVMFLLPPTYKFIILGFLIYRFFDIVKPFFGRLGNLPGGWGIMLDDLFAAIFTNLILQVLCLTKIL